MKKFGYLFLLLFSLSSCVTKQIAYFQDFQPGQSRSVQNPVEIKFKPGDEISILVSTPDKDLSAMFSLYSNIGSGMSVSGSGTKGSQYVIDSEGFIRFPMLGRVYVSGLSREELQEEIRTQIIEKELVRDPIVTVNYSNLHVTVLGDIGAGRVPIDHDQFTILDALGQRGDLNLTGKRTNIKVIRSNYDKQTLYEVNLCSADSLYNSPVYYLQQNDVIYVEQNEKQKRTATVMGNTVLTPSFWMSIATFTVTVLGWTGVTVGKK